MKPTEEIYIDKSTWGDGPWQNEPDRVEWRFAGTPRLALLIVRNRMGALCGYVGVSPGHPWHGKNYSEVDAEVHGGLTYSDACVEGGKICHVALPGEPEEVWWQGFDCGHCFDLAPGMNARLSAYDYGGGRTKLPLRPIKRHELPRRRLCARRSRALGTSSVASRQGAQSDRSGRGC